MELKSRFITKDDFFGYFGRDLEKELPDLDNVSNKVEAFLVRNEHLVESWLSYNYKYRFDIRYDNVGDWQKYQYKLALLQQALYTLENGDIGSDSGYDRQSGVVAGRQTLNQITLSQRTLYHLEQGGFLTTQLQLINYKSGKAVDYVPPVVYKDNSAELNELKKEIDIIKQELEALKQSK